MRYCALVLVLVVALCGCTRVNGVVSSVSLEQAQAGAAYLDSSIVSLQKALDEAKAGGDAAKIKQAQQVLDEATKASSVFKSTLAQSDWDFARSIITTAVEVVAPIVVKALVSGS